MNKKERKCKDIIIDLRKKMRDNNGIVNYSGYMIKECFGRFESPYYTIINTTSCEHVHSKSLNTAKLICECASILRDCGVLENVSLDVYYRSSKLALRIDKNNGGKTQ